jgi:uncharacterized protein YozE (UPF0346 family)
MKKEIKKLFAGPFVGEFGWELFCWQGHIRYLAQNKFNHTTVCCLKGHKLLYEDFANEIIEHEVLDFKPDGHINFGDNGNYPKPDSSFHYLGPHSERIPRYIPDIGVFDERYPQSFHSYKNISKVPQVKVDFLINARSRIFTGRHKSSIRNLNSSKWNEIVDYLNRSGYLVASIGLNDHSEHIENTLDLRGITLSELSIYMSNAKAVLGPSSGPMHFAALCETPVLVWSGTPYNKFRYENGWNPFKSSVIYLNGWNEIKPQTIIQALENNLDLFQ